MEPRCVLPSMRIISVPADCTRSQLGAGRNRYVRIIVRRKLLYAGSTEDHRNASAAQPGAAEFAVCDRTSGMQPCRAKK